LAALGAGGALDLAAIAAAGPLAGQPLGAFRAAGDCGPPPLRGQSAPGVEFDHGSVAERLDVLGPT
jgi:hypothetical protein